MIEIELYKSWKSGKKWTVIVYMNNNSKGKTIHFGASGYEDYTIHRDVNRKTNYISRHKKRENWNKSGILTAGFWSRWLLWNKPSIQKSIKDIETRFRVKIFKL